jgi:hypothetical protein
MIESGAIGSAANRYTQANLAVTTEADGADLYTTSGKLLEKESANAPYTNAAR